MRKLGFLVSDTGDNQLAYHIIKNVNAYYEHHEDVDFFVFFNNIGKTWLFPQFSFMNISEAYSFDGVAVATDLNTAVKLTSMPGPSQKFFYVWDMEWLRDPSLSYEELRDIYLNPKLNIIVRCKTYADMFEYCWGRRPYAICENVNITQLLQEVNYG